MAEGELGEHSDPATRHARRESEGSGNTLDEDFRCKIYFHLSRAASSQQRPGARA